MSRALETEIGIAVWAEGFADADDALARIKVGEVPVSIFLGGLSPAEIVPPERGRGKLRPAGNSIWTQRVR